MKKRLPRSVRAALVVAAAGFLLVAHEARAQIIVNGDFELGNVGWTTDYPEDGPPPSPIPGDGNFMDTDHYVLTDNPFKFHDYAPSYKDHTTGSGLMMMVQGSRTPNQIVWSQTVSVVPNTSYRFSAFVSGWSAGPSRGGTVVPPGSVNDFRPAVLDFYLNNILIGTHTGDPNIGGVWDEFATDVNSGSLSSATLKIIDRNTVSSGNDSSLDDITLKTAAIIVSDLTVAVGALDLGAVEADLLQPLTAAASKLDDANTNNDQAAVQKIQAFILQVEAQRLAGFIGDDDAGELTKAAQAAIGLI